MADSGKNSIYESRTGRQFVLKSNEFGWRLIHDRSCIKNSEDITRCAALSMHKALIGVSSLDALEDAGKKCGNVFRSSIAVSTYYVVYHVFCACILMDDQWDLVYVRKSNNQKLNPETEAKKYEISLEQLNSTDESANTWNNCKDYEQDISTKITHGEIKRYCSILRDKRESKPEFIKHLYLSFVKDNADKAIPALFEKLDYIRDRIIYRPSVVVKRKGGYAQTSKDIRKEIDELPRLNDLYNAIKEILFSIKDFGEKGKQFWLYFTVGSPVSCEESHLKELNYTWDDAERLRGNRQEKILPAVSYQLIELFDSTDAISFFEKYWSPLFSDEDWNF